MVNATPVKITKSIGEGDDAHEVEAFIQPASIGLYERKGWTLAEEEPEKEEVELTSDSGEGNAPEVIEPPEQVEVIDPGQATGQPSEDGTSGKSSGLFRR